MRIPAGSLLLMLAVAGSAIAAGRPLPEIPTHALETPTDRLPRILGQPFPSPRALVETPQGPEKPPSSSLKGDVEGGESWWSAFWTAANATLVAVFTGLLVLVGAIQARRLRQTVAATERAAKAAKQSADALPTLERAYIFLRVEETNFVRVIGDVSTGRILSDLRAAATLTSDREDLNARIGVLRVYFRFTNHGNTPAAIKEISTTATCFSGPPNFAYSASQRLPSDRA